MRKSLGASGGVSEVHAKFRRRRQQAPGLDVVGLGECSIDEVWLVDGLPAAGSKVRAARRDRLGGGQVATAMVACARLGLRAAYVGAVGDDAAGAEVRSGLSAEGVDVSRVRVVAGGATRTALILVDAACGERTIVEHRNAAVMLDPAALPLDLLGHACVLHLDATEITASVAAARAARELGLVVSLDVDQLAPGLDELLALVDVCVTSAALPCQLTGEADPERALEKLRRRTGPFVACTLGARGAMAIDGDSVTRAPALTMPVVDTTSAGDAFHAAVICALLEGRTVIETLRFANAAAALTCRDLGRRGCPTRDEVLALMAQADG